MNRLLVFALAAFQAVLVIAIGIGIPLALLTLVWAIQYGFAANWLELGRIAIDSWLLGHGVPLTIMLPENLTLGIEVPGVQQPFRLSLAPLGILLLTLGLAVRAGRRLIRMPYRLIGLLASVLAFEAVVLLLTPLGLSPAAAPSLPLALLLPIGVYLLGMLIGAQAEMREPRLGPAVPAFSGERLGPFVLRLPQWWNDPWAATMRSVIAGGLAAMFAVLAAAAALSVVQLLLSVAPMLTLQQSLHAGVVGGILLTVLQALLLPNVVVYAASWLIGPGFAVGVGSSVSPVGTELGPIPALPLLGMLPEQAPTFAFLGLAVPLATGLLIGLLWQARLVKLLGAKAYLARAVAGIGIAVVAGFGMMFLALAANGSAGPGRLAVVGPQPWPLGAIFAAELLIPLLAGLFLGSAPARSARLPT